MSGHAPGTWKACRDGNCPCGAIWDATGDIHLATAFDSSAIGMDCFGSDIGVTRKTRISNARLIAAAPTMQATIDAQAARIAELEAALGELDWQPIDTAPQGLDVLVNMPDVECGYTLAYLENGWRSSWDGKLFLEGVPKPMFWMKPSPPKASLKEAGR